MSKRWHKLNIVEKSNNQTGNSESNDPEHSVIFARRPLLPEHTVIYAITETSIVNLSLVSPKFSLR